MSIQYTAPGFEPTTIGARVSSHNLASAPALYWQLLTELSVTATIQVLRYHCIRFSSPGSWLHILHERSMVQLLLSTVHHNVRTRANPELTRDCLGLIIQIARTPTGCDSMVSFEPRLNV